MFMMLQVLAVLSVAIAMALALAHALEWPGKMRLSKQQYLDVQPIYYPGFTFGGIAEPAGILLTLVLLLLTPKGGAVFWLTGAALLALILMHAVYWLLTHPVNNFWLKDFKLKDASARFFSLGALRDENAPPPEWKTLRDRWEFSHAVRAGFGVTSLILLVSAVAV